jgi:hypothetical protein
MKRLVVATGGGAVIRPVNWYLEFTSIFPVGIVYFVASLILINNIVISLLYYQEIHEEGPICLVGCALGRSC